MQQEWTNGVHVLDDECVDMDGLQLVADQLPLVLERAPIGKPIRQRRVLPDREALHPAVPHPHGCPPELR